MDRSNPSMEFVSKPRERENPSPTNYLTSNGATSLSSSNSNGVHIPTSTPTTRSNPNPYPTTFVQADTSNLLDLPSLTLSPVTPVNDDAFDKSSSSPSLGYLSEEERAIAEKGFYLHPSPMSTPRELEPQLLPLFLLTTPRDSYGSSS